MFEIVNIRQGEGNYRSMIQYAELREVSDGNIVCNASLEYILEHYYNKGVKNYEESLRNYIRFNDMIRRTK